MRGIYLKEKASGLSVRCLLLDHLAPKSAEFVWQLASRRMSLEAIHAMWTGPELSCPIPASVLPDGLSAEVIPQENATSFPDAGDVVISAFAAHAVKGLPDGNFFDLGVYYGAGGRMLMPFGWMQANVCAQVIAEDMETLRVCMASIRRNGACRLQIEPWNSPQA